MEAPLLYLRHSTSTIFQMFDGDVKIVKNNQRKRPFAIESDERIDFKFELISSAPFSCSIISDARNNIFFQDRQNSLANLKNNQCHKKILINY